MDDPGHPESNLQTRPRVLDEDVLCATCGYDLRGLPADGNCPECGGAIVASLIAAANPRRVAWALALLGRSYLGSSLALLFTTCCIGSDSPSAAWIIALLLGGASLLRYIAVRVLNRQPALREHPTIGSHLRPLTILLIAEGAIVAAVGAATILPKAGISVPYLSAVLVVAGGAWLILTAASMWFAGELAHSLAAPLDRPRIEAELKVQRQMLVILVCSFLIALVLVLVGTYVGEAGAMVLLGVIIVGLSFFIASAMSLNALVRTARGRRA
jgi:hypothetical protein